MSITTAICYLDADSKVVGIYYECTEFTVEEGEVTASTLPYPYTRVFPLEFLVADQDPLTIRVYTQAEMNYYATVEEAEECRDECIEEPITVHDGIWKMGLKDRENIQDGIDEAAMVGLPESYEQDWIMANGTIFKATPLKLAQVLQAYRTRKQAIYNDYITWLRTGSVTEYTCTVTNVYVY